jgi:hypothetical protein
MADEAAFENLLQIMALLIDQLGGEFIFSREQFDAYRYSKVQMKYISEEYVRLRTINPEVEAEDYSERTPDPSE